MLLLKLINKIMGNLRDLFLYKMYMCVYSLCSYVLEVLILGRYINDGIRTFMISKHNNPVCIHGTSRGDGSEEYMQPAAIAIDPYKNLVSNII